MEHYFCGWYFRCQSQRQTVAFIPARHISNGAVSGSLQIISDTGNRMISFAGEDTRVEKNQPCAVLGRSVFSGDGIRLDLHAEDVSAEGELRFGAGTPLRYDIMGPFRCVPFMECRHSVASMRHSVNGSIRINGEEYRFQNGDGYIEGDRGRSFPRQYAWTQCFFPGGSLMLSVAEIPLGPLRFTGIIGVVRFRDKEYRLATYLGAQAVMIQNGTITVRQGQLSLTAQLLEKKGFPLKAPDRGAMSRSIRENVTCRARYRFSTGDNTLFAFETPCAAFEYEYPL